MVYLVSSLLLASPTVLVAILVFGASVSALLARGLVRLAVGRGGMSNAGYGPFDLTHRATALSNPDIERWSALGFTNNETIDGQPVVTVVDAGTDEAPRSG